MVHLEGSNDEWEQHTHTSGRVFLSNKRTSETRWLWQKWDMNGRLFVRNICDSQQQFWVDQMDLHMRLVAGMASPEEVAQYTQAHEAKQKHPSSQHLPHHSTSYSPLSHSHMHNDSGSHLHPNRSADLSGFNVEKPPFSSQDFSYRNPVFSQQKALHLQQFHSATEPAHLSHFNPDSAEPQHHDISALHPVQTDSSRQYGDPHIAAQHYPNNSRFPIDRNHHESPFFYDTKRNVPFHHHDKLRSRPNNSDLYRPLHVKRPPDCSSTAPFWADGEVPNPNTKRIRRQDFDPEVTDRPEWRGKAKSTKSRFTSLPSNNQTLCRIPRPAPAPVVSGSVPLGRRESSFKPRSRAAEVIFKVCLKVKDTQTVATLHDRDFKTTPHAGSSQLSLSLGLVEEEYAFEAVIGTCEAVEKDYLRLTSAPKPSAVRPPRVLKEALRHVKVCWRDSERDYDWVCRQLKSIRQDYKVQHIDNTDVLDVYETHARIALENRDLGEFNTCVAQVQELYKKVDRIERVRDEFASYRILYNLLVGADEWEQGKILAQFSIAERRRKATRFALQIRAAVVSGNYHRYFKMSHSPPSKTMISFLLAHFQDRMRCRAISTMSSAYGPGMPGSIPLSFVLNELGWSDGQHSAHMPTAGDEITNSEDTKARMMQFSPKLLSSLPNWCVAALKFIVGIRACIKSEATEKGSLERLHLDCKATKVSGVKMPSSGAKLITHAGS